MGPMEGNQEIEDDEYSRVLDNEKAAHQFLSYILKKPALCAYCKGVLIGKVCYDVVWYNAPSDWLSSVIHLMIEHVTFNDQSDQCFRIFFSFLRRKLFWISGIKLFFFFLFFSLFVLFNIFVINEMIHCLTYPVKFYTITKMDCKWHIYCYKYQKC